MAKKFIFVFIALVAFLYLAHTSHALIGTIQPPRMILRTEAPSTVSGFVDVINSNNVSVNIKTDIFGDIENITQLSETNMTLQPNETRRVDFDIHVPSGGRYVGEIIFIFSSEENETQGAALSGTIIVIAEGDSQVDGNQTGNQTDANEVPVTGELVSVWYLLPAGIGVIAVVILASLLIYKRRSV